MVFTISSEQFRVAIKEATISGDNSYRPTLYTSHGLALGSPCSRGVEEMRNSSSGVRWGEVAGGKNKWEKESLGFLCVSFPPFLPIPLLPLSLSFSFSLLLIFTTFSNTLLGCSFLSSSRRLMVARFFAHSCKNFQPSEFRFAETRC